MGPLPDPSLVELLHPCAISPLDLPLVKEIQDLDPDAKLFATYWASK